MATIPYLTGLAILCVHFGGDADFNGVSEGDDTLYLAVTNLPILRISMVLRDVDNASFALVDYHSVVFPQIMCIEWAGTWAR